MGLLTLPLEGGTGTGQIGLVTLPCVVDPTAWKGLAAAQVTEAVKIMTNAAKRNFSRDEFI